MIVGAGKAKTSGGVEVLLLEVSGQWSHRDRHRHHEFKFQVPPQAEELRVRLRWGPGHLGVPVQTAPRNLLTLSVFDPGGFRGAAVRWRVDQEIVVRERSATPGFIPGKILPGGWAIVVDTHEILNDATTTGLLAFELEAATRTAPALPTDEDEVGNEPVVDLAGPTGSAGSRWFQGDLHSHTVHSDGSLSVTERAEAAVKRGLDFLAITDHNTISQAWDGPWPGKLSRIRGSEITTFHGHMNVLGLGNAIDWRGERQGGGAAGILRQAARQNAVAVINHPSSFGNPGCTGCHWDYARVDYSMIDAVEVWNGPWSMPETDNEGALALWTDLLEAGLHPTAIAGTDSHSAEDDRQPGLGFNFVFATDAREASILTAIRHGHVYLSSRATLTFLARGSNGAEVHLPGDRLRASGSIELTVHIGALATRATLWFVADGIAIPLGILDPPGGRVRHAAHAAERWWRLEVREGEGPAGDLLALTNPVYANEWSAAER
jgi:hypothetical protein